MSHASLAATAKRLIAKNGRALTLRKQSRTPKDPAKPWRGKDCADTDALVTGVIVGYQEKDIDGTRVKRGDQQALVAATDVNLDISQWDLLIDGGTHFRIIDAELVAPGDVDILWKVQVRN